MCEDPRYWKYKQFDDRMKYWEDLGESFFSTLEQNLKIIVIEHREMVRLHQDNVQDKLEKIAIEGAHKVFDEFDLVHYRSSNKLEARACSGIPHLQTKEEAEVVLKQQLEHFPKDGWEIYAASFWQTFEKGQKEAMFITDVFNKAKEVLVNHYEDFILGLEADFMRNLNSGIHFWAQFTFAKEVYALEKEIRLSL